jgi:uncharacterized protein YjbJ (UPF0337 family)
MDKNRVKGIANQAKGTAKTVAGKTTDDAKLKAEGKADKIKGKVENAIGARKTRCAANKAPNFRGIVSSPSCVHPSNRPVNTRTGPKKRPLLSSRWTSRWAEIAATSLS